MATFDTLLNALNSAVTQTTELQAYAKTLESQKAQLQAQLTDALNKIKDLEGQGTTILWGSSIWPLTGETNAQALTRTNSRIGPLQIVRYFSGEGKAPTWPSWLAGYQLHYSFKLAPREVLAGTHDAAIRSFLSAAPAKTTYLTYWHEPEDDVELGDFTATDYKNAWRRIAGLVKASGKNVKMTLCLMEWSLRPESGRNWKNFYPGADVVDVLAWDAYHGKGRAASDIYSRPRSVSQAEGKPWAIAETGVASDIVTVATERNALLTALAKDASTVSPKPVFVCYFDSPVGNNAKGWPITPSSAASAAWVAGRG